MNVLILSLYIMVFTLFINVRGAQDDSQIANNKLGETLDYIKKLENQVDNACHPSWTIIGADGTVNDCVSYKANEWCTDSGDFGPKWDKDWGTFDEFENADGLTPYVCPQCGCGKRKSEVKAHLSKAFTNIQQLEEVAVNIEALSEKALSTSISAQHALIDAELKSHKINVAVGQRCNSDWSINDGQDTCATYLALKWCTVDGDYGESWEHEWGVFSDFRNAQNESPLVCYECGCGRNTREQEEEKNEKRKPGHARDKEKESGNIETTQPVPSPANSNRRRLPAKSSESSRQLTVIPKPAKRQNRNLEVNPYADQQQYLRTRD